MQQVDFPEVFTCLVNEIIVIDVIVIDVIVIDVIIICYTLHVCECIYIESFFYNV